MGVEMKIIKVLVSTYNGEKFISDQIESILDQKFDQNSYSLQVVIRDDGSTDHTYEIIQKIIDKYDNVSLLPFTKNLGFAKSFMELLSETDADYYFFSDQDDIWEPNKLEDFLSIMVSKEITNPILGVFSDAWIADQFAVSTGIKLLETRKLRIKDSHVTFMQQIFETYVAGASLCINKKARDQILKFDYNTSFSREAHDYFIALVISRYGELYFLDKPTLRYRQTGNNIYGARDSKKQSIMHRVMSLYSRVKDVQRAMHTGALLIRDISNEQDLSKIMLAIATGKSSFFTRFKFFWEYRRYVSNKYPVILSVFYTLFTAKSIN